MRDYKIELEKRCAYIRNLIRSSGTNGVVFGNSGGKDSALVGILCKKALGEEGKVIGVMMPCESRQNFEEDIADARQFAEQFGIPCVTVDLTGPKREICEAVGRHFPLNAPGKNNVAPRLRMTTVYLVAASLNLLVAGTGNKSERYMGYFTKWGDGAYDFNPISDLTVTEVYEFLAYLNAPENILRKPPSAGLFDGQTDEAEMGVTYGQIDRFLSGEAIDPDAEAIIRRYHARSEHKRRPGSAFEDGAGQ